MELILVPLIGPFHLRSPAYNGMSVRDLVAAWQPDVLATSALTEQELRRPEWQDTPEIALPLAVVPWARKRAVPFHALGEDSQEDGAEESFRRYAGQYPALAGKLAQVDSLLKPVAEQLERAQTMDSILASLLPALLRHQQAREEAFEDGPASGWLRRRMERVAARVLELPYERTALLAPVEQIPLLEDALASLGASPGELPLPAAGPDARERALLDYAFLGETEEPGRLLARLRDVDAAEARYHEANLLLSQGHGFEALDLLENASRGDFRHPYFLPGYLLARLGQLRDLAGRRDDALRAYRGVLALDYAPEEAKAAAREGLKIPFSP